MDSPCRILLAGGSTPRALYRRLAEESGLPSERWRGIQLFFGDERCVPPDHPDSNFEMVRGALLEPLGPGAPAVYRIRGEDPSPDAAAREYEETVRRAFGISANTIPSFDLALLGVGTDGHTASLFPGEPAGEESGRLFVATRNPRDGSARVTATYALLDATRRLVFLAVGAEKADAVARSLKHEEPGVEPTPAGRVRLASGDVVWILDRDAARRIG